MSIKISGGITENGIVIGNAFDKYGSRNPIVKWMMKGFDAALFDFVTKASPQTIHEIGCGEGYWVLRWQEQGIAARGCDFSNQVIEIARDNAVGRGFSPALFESRSIYGLEAGRDSADLVVCCEVLEHLERPDLGLQLLQQIVGRHLILSVPKEPLWCALNLVRGKYITQWGNTPGHIQHWSKMGFIKLISNYFDIIEIKTPLPWTMVLCKPYV